MLISLVIPCFNERESIPALLLALDTAVQELARVGHSVECIIVDDGSRDGSPQLLKDATHQREYLRVICLSRNFGQTAALSAGFAEAGGEVIVALDADLQNDPADIPRLLERLGDGYDVVSGWRKDRHDKTLSRILPSILANKLISWTTGVRLHDYGCTLKAYRQEVIQEVRLYGEMHRLLPVYAAWQGARVTELPVRHHPRRAGQSKYSLSRVPNVVLDLLLVRLLWSYGQKPIHLFGKFGLGSLALSLLSFLGMLYFKFWGDKSFIQTPLPQLTVTFFLIGCLSVLIGFLAEITVRTYHEATGSPTYVIRQRIPEERFRAATIPPSRPVRGG